jgi:hypothetical protein
MDSATVDIVIETPNNISGLGICMYRETAMVTG